MVEDDIKQLAISKGLDVVEEMAGFSVRDNGKQIRFCFNTEKLQAFLQSYVKKVRKYQGDSSARIITCPSCRQKIRIRLPLPRSIGKCSKCLTRFELSIDESDFIYITKLDSINNENYFDNELHTIADCLSILEVEPSATSKEIKLSYRNKIKEYHPDKVEKMGSKIKKVAIEESKIINAAYSMLKENGYTL